MRRSQRAGAFEVRAYSPLVHPARNIDAGRGCVLYEELGDVEADAAGSDQSDLFAGADATGQHIYIRADLGVVGARELHLARGDTGRQHDFVETALREVLGGNASTEPQFDAVQAQLFAEVAQGLMELFLAGNALGQIELAADLAGAFEKRNAMAAFGRY